MGPLFTDWFWVLKAPSDRFDLKTDRFEIKIARFDLKILRFEPEIVRFEFKIVRFDLKTARFKPFCFVLLSAPFGNVGSEPTCQ